MWFKKKKTVAPIVAKIISKAEIIWNNWVDTTEDAKSIMPITNAVLRLEGGAKDFGADRAIPMYNSLKTKVNNQWVNPYQSINTGNGTAQLSSYLYQNVNYYECMCLAQDGIFANVFRILSETPLSKAGELVADGLDAQSKDAIEIVGRRYNLLKTLKGAIKSSFVSGGCLIYLDFGLSPDELEQPLNLNTIDCRTFKGFKKIDPINVTAVDVNTSEPSKQDYMNPKKWYVIGLGVVHHTHFLKFEQNVPEDMLKPVCMFFGFPLSLIIKNDVANAQISSQGLANIINKIRYTYLKTDLDSYMDATSFRNRLEFMAKVQDNFSICPIKTSEEVTQNVLSLTGYAESVQLFYQLLASKTSIPQSILLGSGTHGFSQSGEGDRRQWYDEVHRIQDSIKSQLLTMYGIIAGKGDGKFKFFNDYQFYPLEEATETEVFDNMQKAVSVTKDLIDFGVKQESALNWLKSNKKFSFDELEYEIKDEKKDEAETESKETPQVDKKEESEELEVKESDLNVD